MAVSEAAASKEARRTLRYVEPLSDARTKLADFFSILLAAEGRKQRLELHGEADIARDLQPARHGNRKSAELAVEQPDTVVSAQRERYLRIGIDAFFDGTVAVFHDHMILAALRAC